MTAYGYSGYTAEVGYPGKGSQEGDYMGSYCIPGYCPDHCTISQAAGYIRY